MLVQFAAAMVVLIGLVGLAVDVGFVTLERRILQNGVDAAALSGAIDMVQSTGTTNATVNTMVSRNQVAVGATVECTYVAWSGSTYVDTAPCTAGTPANSSGVRVRATNTRNTYLMQVLGIPTATIAADAIAEVIPLSTYNASGSPFIVCGYNTRLAHGGNMNILSGNQLTGPWSVNPTAVGQTFVIHGPHVSTCNLPPADFKGLMDEDEGGMETLPSWLEADNGTVAGPTNVATEAINGCQAGVDPHNCVIMIPVAVDGVKDGSQNRLYSVMWLPFNVTSAGSNVHHGRLLSASYVVKRTTTSNPPPGSWTFGTGSGPVSVRAVQ